MLHGFPCQPIARKATVYITSGCQRSSGALQHLIILAFKIKDIFVYSHF